MQRDEATNPTDDARVGDHLANERTYLAWMRTGIATMGFGILIARLRYLFPSAALAPPNPGLLFTLIGILTVVVAAWRYLIVQRQLRRGAYQTPTALIISFSLVVIVLGLLILWYLSDGVVTHQGH